jgi:hypothetical protein
MSFNFENIFIIGNKITGTGGDVEYNLTCYENDDGELYSYIWDNEEDLIKWKSANSIDTKYNLIDFNYFLKSFILRETGLKWLLLNPSSRMTDSEVLDKPEKEKLMLFSILGIKPILEFYASSLKERFSKALIDDIVLNNPDLPPSEFISIFPEKIKELSSSIEYLSEMEYLSDSDIFEKDLSLEHVILNNIQYYDPQEEEFIDVNIELFGHCFKIVRTHDDLEIRVVFDPKREIECRVTNKDTADDSSYIINTGTPKTITYSFPISGMDDYTFSPDSGFIFVLSKKKLNKFKSHLKNVNKTIDFLEKILISK